MGAHVTKKMRLRSFLLAGSCALLMATPVLADGLRAFTVPAGDLKTALDTFARQAGIELVYKTADVAGKTTSGVTGSFDAHEALSRLLTGTALTISKDRSGAILIAGRAATNATPEAGSSTSDSPTPQAPGQPADTSKNRAGAQSESDKVEKVTVTGTRIRGRGVIGSPVRTLDRDEIEQSGYDTVEKVIQSLPANNRGGAAGASADSFFSTGQNAGFNFTSGSGVNLRGIGNNATLVLINGHRLTRSGGGYFTDISTIPLSAIERIDVLSDGASPIYGSDAIAGVVNIILRREFDGFESTARYGSTTESGYGTYGGSLQGGTSWNSGGLSVGLDYSHRDIFDASERKFTAGVVSPTSIFPEHDQFAITAAAHQALSERLEVVFDGQYVEKEGLNYYSGVNRQPTNLDRWSASIGATYEIADTWSLSYDLSAGEEDDQQDTFACTPNCFPGNPFAFLYATHHRSELLSHNAVLSGDLMQLPAGAAKIAVGASYMEQRYQDVFFSPEVEQRQTAAFGEIQIPIIDEVNSVPGIHALTLSAALRWDDYTGFGDTTNPRIGISWFPVRDLELRGAYSTSFRAPAPGQELLNSELGTRTVALFAFTAPNGVGQVPVAYLLGAQPDVGPETADNISIGLNYRPHAIDGLNVSLNYYDIDYTDQLATPPFTRLALTNPAYASIVTTYANPADVQAAINAFTAGGASFFDFTFGAFGPNPLASTLYVVDGRIQNLSSTTTTGIDATVQYDWDIGADEITLRVDMTKILEFETSLTANSPQISRVDTVGFPADLRIRAQANWRHDRFNLSGAVNYVDAYPDTSSLAGREVSAYTTADLVFRYDFWEAEASSPHRVTGTLGVSNVFDEDPPYVNSGARLPGSHYDPANADPSGRFVYGSIGIRW
jgi:iron complex outermembrane recepter protein